MKIFGIGKKSKPSPNTKTFVDISTSKLTCVMAKKNKNNGNIEIISKFHQFNKSVFKGKIKSLDTLEKCIVKVVHNAEQIAKEVAGNITVGLPASSYKSIILNMEVDINNHIITSKHIKTLVDYSKIKLLIPNGMDIVHFFPIEYSVDDLNGIKDPRGLSGKKLLGIYNVVLCPSQTIQSIKSAFYHCHLDVDMFWADSYARQRVINNKFPESDSVFLIDIGFESTTLSYYYNNVLSIINTIQIGSNHVTNDISKGLNVASEEAERIKSLDGVILPITSGVNENNNESKQIISKIIRARMEEILELSWNPIQRQKLNTNPNAKIIFSGGITNISGFKPFASEMLQSEILLWNEIFNDNLYSGLSESTQSLVRSGIYSEENFFHNFNINDNKNIFQKTYSWMKENF